jgi:long-chain acyl-CoA synthetase
MLIMPDALVRSRQTAARRTAVVCGDVELDHESLAGRCEQVVGLLDGLGLRTGDRVAVLAANCHRYVEAYLGVPAAGMVLVPLNTRLAPAELVEIGRTAQPALLLTDRDPGPLGEEVGRVITFDEWETLLRAAPPGPLGTGVTEDDVALLYFTSGTTGRPKGVILTHRTRRSPAGSCRATCSSPRDRSSTWPARRRCSRSYGSVGSSSCSRRSTRRPASTRSRPAGSP